MVIQKDLSSIAFGETSLEADIHSDEIIYSFMAKASQTSIVIDKGEINKEKDTHEAKIAFGFNKYAIQGGIEGSIR